MKHLDAIRLCNIKLSPFHPSSSRQTADEYLKEYNRRRGNEYSRFHGYTYDGIWAVALAIQFASQQKDVFLQNFEYRDKNWENVFLWALGNTSFEGVTGPVRFYNNERKASFQLNQFQNGEEVKVGEYSSLQTRLDLTRGEPLKWVKYLKLLHYTIKY